MKFSKIDFSDLDLPNLLINIWTLTTFSIINLNFICIFLVLI